jgi:hypothetical protein
MYAERCGSIHEAVDAFALPRGDVATARNVMVGGADMYRIEVTIALKVNEAACIPEPEVKLWLDLEPGLSEIELPLEEVRDREWHGTFEVHCCHEQFSYRLGLCAQPEAEWWIRFRDAESGAELLVDGDRLMMTKGWSLGTCRLNDAASRRNANHAKMKPHLVLVRARGRGSRPR